MRDTLINLAIIFYCLQAAPIFAEHQIELHPVYSKSNQHTGYAAKVMIGEPKKEFSLLLDTVTSFLWVFPPTFALLFSNGLWEMATRMPGYSSSQSQTVNRTNYIHLDQIYDSRKVTMTQFTDNISFNSLNGIHADFPSSPFCEARILQWREFDDYQKIDGMLGLSTLHAFGAPFGIPCYSFSCQSVVDNPTRRAIRNYELKPVITIALPPLDSDKTAMLTLGGRNNQLCDLNYETTELLRLKYEATELLRLVNENTEPQSRVPLPPSHHIASNQSGNRYEFKYNSIKMGDVMSSVVSFAHLSTIEPFISVPYEFLSKIVTNLNATFDSSENKYKVQCKGSVPYDIYQPFEISTDSNTYVVPPQHFIIKHNPNDTQCELTFRKSERTIYSLYVSGIPVEIFEDNDPNIVVLGIPFFHQYCVTLKPHDHNIIFAPII
ncbi:unnamed protein product [Cercopithifilaria johnstoni]|uniref:Peptidase A1 domain-containing protein n=1 Tax=Cercopithifilaria johnstoni TaxID=2874296 RepID=A0A8J2Q3Y6_9BILA|nr:unnamed protein product [Cercopithifilaria johnstoni]